jgi:hypothetical protein
MQQKGPHHIKTVYGKNTAFMESKFFLKALGGRLHPDQALIDLMADSEEKRRRIGSMQFGLLSNRKYSSSNELTCILLY